VGQTREGSRPLSWVCAWPPAGRTGQPLANPKKHSYTQTMALNKELISILACPKCKGPLQLAADESSFTCLPCRLVFEVQEGIPNFLLEDAKPLETDPAA